MKGYKARYKKNDRIGGKYRVYEVLMGGMGEVYLCLDQDNLPHALKTFQGSDKRMKALFEAEVKNWISLEKHPNIVQLHYMEEIDNIPFMFLDWIIGDADHGTDLRSWLRNGALDPALSVKYTSHIVNGLKFANEKSPGIVHRDLKPDNILIDLNQHAKITDFGLAAVFQKISKDSSKSTTKTAGVGGNLYVADVVGTPYYMPPEQWQANGDIDFRTDIYAIGCILYELLTGDPPFIGKTVRKIREKHLGNSIPKLKNQHADLNRIVQKCLAKSKTQRYASLDKLLRDLLACYKAIANANLQLPKAEAYDAYDYNNRGSTYHRLGLYDLAKENYNKAIQIAPNYSRVYYNRGTYYYSLKQYQQALQDYSKAIQIDPNFTTAIYDRGTLYHALGELEKALHDYEETIHQDPYHAKAYTNRGGLYVTLEQEARAIKDFDKAIQIDPTYASAYFNKGIAVANLGHPREALKLFQKAQSLGMPQARQAIEEVMDML